MAVLTGRDFKNRDKLLSKFREKVKEMAGSDKAPEERVSIASGMAVYDPKTDDHVDKVLKRADEEMYINKRLMKQEEK